MRVAAGAEMELQIMNGADDMAGLVDITVSQGGAGMGAGVGEGIPLLLIARDAEFFTIDGHFGDVAGSPLEVGLLVGDLIPLVL